MRFNYNGPRLTKDELMLKILLPLTFLTLPICSIAGTNAQENNIVCFSPTGILINSFGTKPLWEGKIISENPAQRKVVVNFNTRTYDGNSDPSFVTSINETVESLEEGCARKTDKPVQLGNLSISTKDIISLRLVNDEVRAEVVAIYGQKYIKLNFTHKSSGYNNAGEKPFSATGIYSLGSLKFQGVSKAIQSNARFDGFAVGSSVLCSNEEGTVLEVFSFDGKRPDLLRVKLTDSYTNGLSKSISKTVVLSKGQCRLY